MDKRYCIYFPEQDKQLCDFLDSQSNVSLSVRLLIKGFLSNYNDRYPDIAVMDLKELLQNSMIDDRSMIEVEREAQELHINDTESDITDEEVPEITVVPKEEPDEPAELEEVQVEPEPQAEPVKQQSAREAYHNATAGEKTSFSMEDPGSADDSGNDDIDSMMGGM